MKECAHKIWPLLLASGCLSAPSSGGGGGGGDADDISDGDAGMSDAGTPDADPARIFLGRYILQPYFTPAGTCADGIGSYNFTVGYSEEYTVENERAYTDQSFSFDEATRHFTLNSEIDSYAPGYHYQEYYTFDLDLAVDGVTVTGTGAFSLFEHDVETCSNPIEVNEGYIQ